MLPITAMQTPPVGFTLGSLGGPASPASSAARTIAKVSENESINSFHRYLKFSLGIVQVNKSAKCVGTKTIGFLSEFE
jgi:hypothetical protein